ncbi:hypothetical protein HZB03_03355, partial [Candidatus Woesearchaeota archaeon]|nr:hypothetical protein [Candidatus Woesearchaeota archaeon]
QTLQKLASAAQQQNAATQYSNAHSNEGDTRRDTQSRVATIYESSAAKSRRMIVYFLFGTFLILFGMVALKRI